MVKSQNPPFTLCPTVGRIKGCIFLYLTKNYFYFKNDATILIYYLVHKFLFLKRTMQSLRYLKECKQPLTLQLICILNTHYLSKIVNKSNLPILQPTYLYYRKEVFYYRR